MAGKHVAAAPRVGGGDVRQVLQDPERVHEITLDFGELLVQGVAPLSELPV